MKIVVIGGTGLIGSQVVHLLQERGHEVLPASPSRGINAVTREGLQAALTRADVVVDVANSPSFEDQAAMDFFEASGRNLQAAERAAGVKHHVALSVVGTERLLAMGYFRAKLRQEELIAAAGVPYTIARATQFFEFAGAIAESGRRDEIIHLPPVPMQPIASQDVAELLADIALAPPVNGMVELAGPRQIRMDLLAREFLTARGDACEVVADPQALYFSTPVDDQSLTPGASPRTGRTDFTDWLKQSAPQPKAG
jgi:uncharacterized protein YbjT (DUF2867 family)